MRVPVMCVSRPLQRRLSPLLGQAALKVLAKPSTFVGPN
jgi:hypothetical protein